MSVLVSAAISTGLEPPSPTEVTLTALNKSGLPAERILALSAPLGAVGAELVVADTFVASAAGLGGSG